MLQKYKDFITRLLDRYVGLRYFIAGGTAGVFDLLALYVFYNIFEIYYLLSAILAFLLAFVVSFTLHKFWTFNSHKESTHLQAVLYLATSMFGLSLNTFLMYIFVDHVHLNVILSQVIVGLMVACCSFFLSRNIVFKYKNL